MRPMRALFHSDSPPTRVAMLWVLVLCALVGWAFARTAAVTEDAFITFRVIDNALHGLGLVWNAGERVQPYTHPLWALMLWAAGRVHGDLYTATLVLSLVLTLLCVALIARNALSPWTALWAVMTLLFSEAFVEYSSAGLENALAHALAAGCVLAWRAQTFTGRNAWLTALCAGLLMITRHDFALLVAPLLLLSFVQSSGRARWAVLLASALPLLAWSIFSLIYYGSPWPNSAYAKLNNGLSLAESFAAARPYFVDLVEHDSVTALVIAVALIRGLLHSAWRMRSLAFGLGLYLAYLGSAGGDYMGGRLFSAPLVWAVAILAFNVRLRFWLNAPIWLIVTLVLGLHRGWIVQNVHPHAQIRKLSQHAWMYPYSGWQSPQRTSDFHNMPWGEQGLRARSEQHAIVAKCAVGLYGFSAGPTVRIIDPLAITDGFLSRLPAKKPAYPGHFERAFPRGYLETVVSGKNQLQDASLRTLYEHTELLARAPLWDAVRWQAIVRLNFGGDRQLVKIAKYDPNATFAPGLANTSRAPLSCMGQLDPLLTVRIK